MEFNRNTTSTSHTVAKFINKFIKTGSFADQSRSGHPRTSTVEGTKDVVLADIVPYVLRLLGNPVDIDIDIDRYDQ